MTLLEYAENISRVPLTDWQKKFLKEYEKAKKEDRFITFYPPRGGGKEAICQIIDDYPEFEKLKEYRCSCGRLLGKFNGQAEIKCPKCGKMNVIGVEKLANSGVTR